MMLSAFVFGFIEILLASSLFLYYIIRAFVRLFIPCRCKSIVGETILITGGGRGLGRLLAVELGKYHPLQIILWGRNEDHLKATRKIIELNGTRCHYIICDVSSKDQIFAKAKETEKTFGPVTMLINNAGVVFGDRVIESDPDNIDYTFRVNTYAHIWTIKAFLPSMAKSNHGHIVTINSILGLQALPGAAFYSASKFALVGVWEALQGELLHDGMAGVLLTSIHPYMFDTDMFAGCRTRFPWLFPALEKEYVAKRSVQAILGNEMQVVMPRLMNFLIVARSILPIDAMLVVHKFFGVDRCMEFFHKRSDG